LPRICAAFTELFSRRSSIRATFTEIALLSWHRAKRVALCLPALSFGRQAGLAAVVKPALLPRICAAFAQAAPLLGVQVALPFRSARHALLAQSTVVYSALLLRRLPHCTTLARRLLSKTGCRSWRIVAEPAMLVLPKRLWTRHMARWLNRIVSFANICLPHELLPEISPAEILSRNFNRVWQ
jgi:hypothetical protein